MDRPLRVQYLSHPSGAEQLELTCRAVSWASHGVQVVDGERRPFGRVQVDEPLWSTGESQKTCWLEVDQIRRIEAAAEAIDERALGLLDPARFRGAPRVFDREAILRWAMQTRRHDEPARWPRCPRCNSVMSHREAAEQGECNDCHPGGAYSPEAVDELLERFAGVDEVSAEVLTAPEPHPLELLTTEAAALPYDDVKFLARLAERFAELNRSIER